MYAAGDATWFPIKQGGLAAQQADVAATSIASRVDAEIEKALFRPVLRGALLTGAAPLYVRSEVGDRAGSSAAGAAPLWWPPSKIAARYLSPYLAAGDEDPKPPLDDLPPLHGEERAELAAEHQEAVELALTVATQTPLEGLPRRPTLARSRGAAEPNAAPGLRGEAARVERGHAANRLAKASATEGAYAMLRRVAGPARQQGPGVRANGRRTRPPRPN